MTKNYEEGQWDSARRSLVDEILLLSITPKVQLYPEQRAEMHVEIGNYVSIKLLF